MEASVAVKNALSTFKEYIRNELKDGASNDELMRKVAKACDVSPMTVLRWVSELHPPKGTTNLALAYYLRAQGYPVSELKHLTEHQRKLGEAIYVEKKATYEEVDKLLELHNGGLLRFLQGNANTSPKRVQIIEDILKRPSAQPEPRNAEEHAVSRSAEQASTNLPSVEKIRSDILNLAGMQIKALRPLLKELVSSNFSAEERKKLRTMLGENGMFEVSNMVSALCGERSREDYLKNL